MVTQQEKIYDRMNILERIVKRFFDILISSVCLIVFSPLCLVCMILINREDGGTAIFSQERIGRGGRAFRIYKFRSMSPNVEASGVPQLYDQENDVHLTRIGKCLRQHHLDELPQFWNVLKGDMSLIGHRPERQFFIDKIMAQDNRYEWLYQIRPGVTSFATLYNGYTDNLDKMLKRLELDLYYLEHRTLWMDAKILFLTFWKLARWDKF